MQPVFKIVAEGGQDATAKIKNRLLSLNITNRSGLNSDILEIRLDDRVPYIEYPKHGTQLQAWLGYVDTGLVPFGQYTVDEVMVNGPPDTLTVRAHAINMQSKLHSQDTREWKGKTIGTLVKTIAGKHGLTPAVGTSLSSKTIQHLSQTNESDLQLLSRLGKQYDAVAEVANGKLLFIRRGEASSASGKKLEQILLMPKSLTNWQVTFADREKAGQTYAYSYDYDKAAVIEKDAQSKIWQDAPPQTLKHPVPEWHIDDTTQAYQRHQDRCVETLSIGMPGDPRITAEVSIQLTGLRPKVDGKWIVTYVQHTLSAQGYTCQLEAERHM